MQPQTIYLELYINTNSSHTLSNPTYLPIYAPTLILPTTVFYINCLQLTSSNPFKCTFYPTQSLYTSPSQFLINFQPYPIPLYITNPISNKLPTLHNTLIHYRTLFLTPHPFMHYPTPFLINFQPYTIPLYITRPHF